MNNRNNPPVRILQERRIHVSHGVSASLAALIARLAYGGSNND